MHSEERSCRSRVRHTAFQNQVPNLSVFLPSLHHALQYDGLPSQAANKGSSR